MIKSEHRRNLPVCLIAGIFLLFSACNKEEEKNYLFNGTDLTGWDTYLGIPDLSQEVTGLDRDEFGNYLNAFGLNNDPLHIFSVVEEDGEPAIRIDGYIWGGLISREEYGNYHLHLDFKWGDEKHPPRENLERNSGICYHSVGEYGVFWTYWMRSFELEIKETGLGDFVRVDDVYATIETRVDNTLTTAPRLRYVAGGFPVQLNTNTYTVRASEDFENPAGEWNSIDLYVLEDSAVYFINENLVMLASELQQKIDGTMQPLTRGRIQLQSEGAEIFYRNIWIETITTFPDQVEEE